MITMRRLALGAVTAMLAVPAVSVLGASPAAAATCNFISDPIQRSSVSDVSRNGGTLSGTGTIRVWARMNCGATVQFKLQRKVCGFWGCNWRDVRTTGAKAIPSTSGNHTYSLSGGCTSGTHSYRMNYRVVWAKFVGDAIESSVDEGSSRTVKFSC
ncbi:hypothetical protein BJY16_005188 [Actinoplanes octamycinicus]|uniref:Secreted protein n=1 Tax=Actinoplanes octamycinicus TaxID=135948 RepID=A0A7W7H0L0_9ACTN|nr:hypothetical protein [Actinoplanes octamycinicus]MBB4741729.1 hypothetical protein [Actinoplanes octamycinicus]GIE57283.1 hypothetical protein Aoc01nite_26850 [Actinoplanes octamycinicus]